MKLPATIKIGLATAIGSWAAPKINAMVTESPITIEDEYENTEIVGGDAPDMIVPLCGVITALSYTVLSLVFGGEHATVKGGGGAS